MKMGFVGMSIIFALISITFVQSNESDIIDNTDIQQPQVGSLQKIAPAYTIPEGMPFDDFFKQFKADRPDLVTITSPNYPEPYPPDYNQTWTISADNGTGIEIIIHDLDLNLENDFLQISTEDNSQKPGINRIFHGKAKALKFRAAQTKTLNIKFVSQSEPAEKNYTGFLLTYTSFGQEIVIQKDPIIQPEIPTDDLMTISKLINIPQSRQNNETYQLLKTILRDSINNYTSKYNLALEECFDNNITIVSIRDCPQEWPGHENCTRLTFAITLYKIEDTMIPYDPEEGPRPFPTDVTVKNLTKMWDKFAEEAFRAHGFTMFEVPNDGGVLFLWIGISLGVFMTLLFIICGICRLDIFRVYNPWSNQDDDKHNILKDQPEFDITTIPSPHQVVPNFFPNNPNGYTPPGNGYIGPEAYEIRSRAPMEDPNETDSNALHMVQRRNKSNGYGVLNDEDETYGSNLR